MFAVLRDHGLRPAVLHRGLAWQMAALERSTG
jgi:hypothetical protein